MHSDDFYLKHLHQHSQEINKRCRQIIWDHVDWCDQVTGMSLSSPCVFGDLHDCLPVGTFDWNSTFAEKMYSIDKSRLRKTQCLAILMSTFNILQSRIQTVHVTSDCNIVSGWVQHCDADLRHCFTCNKPCPLFGLRAESHFEMAGLPCTDQSRAGKQQFEEGPTGSVFITHSKRHIEMRTPLILLENVQAVCPKVDRQTIFWLFCWEE